MTPNIKTFQINFNTELESGGVIATTACAYATKEEFLKAMSLVVDKFDRFGTVILEVTIDNVEKCEEVNETEVADCGGFECDFCGNKNCNGACDPHY